MTYKQLQDEVIALRFNEGKRASIKSWLNVRYTAIWALRDWHWKHVAAAPWTVPAGDQAPPMFSDFAKCEGLYDQFGDPIEYLPPRKFTREFLGYTGSAQSAEAYTVVNRQILLAPVPQATVQYAQDYERRVSHVDVGGDAAAGTMLEDGDQPIWPAEFDYLLVLDATLMGQRINGDPTSPDLKAERDELLEALAADSAGSGSTEPVFWGGGC